MAITARSTFAAADPTDYAAIAAQFREGDARDWFRWKYCANPWVDEPMVFTLKEGEDIVAAVGFVPLSMSTPSGRRTGVLLGDIATRPSHESDLDTVIVDRAGEYLARDGVPFAFAASMPFDGRPTAMEGWTDVTALPSFVRLNRVSALFGSRSAPLDPVIASTTRAIAAIHRRLGAIGRSLSREPLDIVSTGGVPVELFGQSFPDTRDGGVHVTRSTSFYRWRYANPMASYRTYVIYRHGTPVGGVIIEYRTVGEVSIATIAEIVCNDRTIRVPLVRCVLAEERTPDVVLAPGTLDRGWVERLGFLGTDRFPGTRLTHRRRLRVQPLLTDHESIPESWAISFAERGIA